MADTVLNSAVMSNQTSTVIERLLSAPRLIRATARRLGRVARPYAAALTEDVKSSPIHEDGTTPVDTVTRLEMGRKFDKTDVSKPRKPCFLSSGRTWLTDQPQRAFAKFTANDLPYDRTDMEMTWLS